MITFRKVRREGVPAVEVMDRGQRLAIIFVEEEEGSIAVMSDRFDGPFTESVEFTHAQVANGQRHPPVVRMKLRGTEAVAKGRGARPLKGKGVRFPKGAI